MKQRNIYLLTFICCMSLFSAANGNANKCASVCTGKDSVKKLETLEATVEADKTEEAGFNFSPLEYFTLSI